MTGILFSLFFFFFSFLMLFLFASYIVHILYVQREIDREALTPVADWTVPSVLSLPPYSASVQLQDLESVWLTPVDVERFHYDISAFLCLYSLGTVIPQKRKNIRAPHCVKALFNSLVLNHFCFLLCISFLQLLCFQWGCRNPSLKYCAL